MGLGNWTQEEVARLGENCKTSHNLGIHFAFSTKISLAVFCLHSTPQCVGYNHGFAPFMPNEEANIYCCRLV